MSIVGKGMMLKGRALTAKGAKIAAVAGKIKAVTTAMKAKIAGAFVVPAIPVIPAVTHKKTKVYVGPQFANLAWNVAHPVTGFRYGTASVGGIRKKRDSETARSESPERPMNELITIVQSRSAQQCLAKVICELSADPNFHGDEGVKFAGTLMALGRANLPRSEHFRSASVTGSRSRNPVLCSHSFSDCGTPSTEVIKIGNALITG